MFALNDIEEYLLQMDDLEKAYRIWYLENPEAYEQPVRSWEEFRSRFDSPIQFSPPTIVKDYLFEKEFFQNKSRQVDCFKNVRYCPPFLHKLEFIKIVYLLQGTALFYLNRRRYEMQEGNFCIVAPGVEQAVFAKGPKGVAVNILVRASTFTRTYSTLLMEQGVLADFFWHMAYTDFQNQVLFFRAKPDGKMRQTVLRLFYEVQMEPKRSSLVEESYVCILLGEGIRRHGEELIVLEGLDGSVYRIPEILRDITGHLQDITLEQLSQKWGMKQNAIRHLLKMETGYSFEHLRAELRLQRAAELLEETEDSIETVMNAVGYYDSAAFYRNFKSKYHVTPQVYRDDRRTKET